MAFHKVGSCFMHVIQIKLFFHLFLLPYNPVMLIVSTKSQRAREIEKTYSIVEAYTNNEAHKKLIEEKTSNSFLLS
jgi:hypothetical protein